MAIIATLLGGIIGFMSFLTALLGFDTGFLTACWVYLGTGSFTTAYLIARVVVPTRTDDADASKVLSA